VSGRRLAVVAAAAGAAVVVLLVGTGLGWWSSPPGGRAPAQPLAAKTLLDPRPAFFGDVVTAEVDVIADTARVRPGSVRVVASFDPYVQSGPAAVSTARVGRRETLRYVYAVQCVSDACVPIGKPLAVRFPRAHVSATVSGRPASVTATWPATSIVSRLGKGDTSATPHFRRNRVLPAPAYGVSPRLLADLLTAAAGLIAAIALALAGFELVRLLERRRRRGLVQLTPLEAALAYTRDAARRPDPADRRKALGLLARILEREGAGGLADRTGDVAWSEPAPSPERAIELAEEVEQTAGTNGS
jgi:hypothetical protein